ncbi:MAG: helix-turn-helix domain-containing protein [Trueperaceae bacterium]
MITNMDGVTTPKLTEKHLYEAREVILFPGASTNVYRVVGGLIRIHNVDDDGNALTLRYVKPGGYFGEEALEGTQRCYFAEAVTASEIEKISPATFTAEQHMSFNHYLVTEMQKLYRSMFRLSGKSLKTRIAAELLELQDSALATLNSSDEAVIRLTHDDLAAAVGSVRETVTKIVGELAKDQAIHSGYGKIILSDVKRLQAIADA